MKRYSASQAWLDVNPDKDQSKDRHLARIRAAEYLRQDTRSRQYIDAVLLQQGDLSDTPLRDIDQTRRDLEAMATADMTDIISWDLHEQEDGSVIWIPKIMAIEHLEPAVRRLIKSITMTKKRTEARATTTSSKLRTC